MLRLLATRIELVFDDDDDDDDDDGDNADPFVAVYAYLRDYSSINQIELSVKQLFAIDFSLKHLESLLPDITEMKRKAVRGQTRSISSSAHDLETSEPKFTPPTFDLPPTASNDVDERLPEAFNDLKKEISSPLRPNRFSENIDSEEDGEWDDDDQDSGWAAVTSLSAPKLREVAFSDEKVTVLLNRDVEIKPDLLNQQMASIFPVNDLPSDSDDDDVSAFEDPNRQFAPEWNIVAFLSDGIPSDPELIIPKQGTEFEKRPLGVLFHQNCLEGDTYSSSRANDRNHSEKLCPLVVAPKAPSEHATPLLVKKHSATVSAL